MTRPARTLNPRALTRLLAILVAAAVVILAAPWFVRTTVRLLGEPVVFLWLLPVAAVLIIGGLLLTGYTYRDRTAELEAELERRDREHAAEVAEKEAECQRLHLLLTEAEQRAARRARDAVADFGAVLAPVLNLRSIPAQRTATHDHLAEDDDWFGNYLDEREEWDRG